MSAGQDFLSSFFELFFLQVIWHPLVIVAKVTVVFLEKGGKPRVAEFAHGSDGMGNISLTPPKAKKCDKNASEFLVDKVSEYPGEVSILALGPLTNLALVSSFWPLPVCLVEINIFRIHKFISNAVLKSGNQKGLILCK